MQRQPGQVRVEKSPSLIFDVPLQLQLLGCVHLAVKAAIPLLQHLAAPNSANLHTARLCDLQIMICTRTCKAALVDGLRILLLHLGRQDLLFEKGRGAGQLAEGLPVLEHSSKRAVDQVTAAALLSNCAGPAQCHTERLVHIILPTSSAMGNCTAAARSLRRR